MKFIHISPTTCFLCRLNACYEEMPFCSNCFFRLNDLLNETCRSCKKTPPYCECTENKEIRFLYYFNSRDSRQLTYTFKYFSQANYVRFWAELLVRNCLKANEGFDGVTYVPRSWWNRQKYGFDQSKKLAFEVAKILNVPVVHALKRRGFYAQKLLSKIQRKEHARRIYKLKRAPKNQYKKLLLLDDIITTGATILACKAVLKTGIAKSVVCAVLARTNTIID